MKALRHANLKTLQIHYQIQEAFCKKKVLTFLLPSTLSPQNSLTYLRYAARNPNWFERKHKQPRKIDTQGNGPDDGDYHAVLSERVRAKKKDERKSR